MFKYHQAYDAKHFYVFSIDLVEFAIYWYMNIVCEIWDTTKFGPGWDSNSQPSDLWANH